jgi:hypothetical protein
MAQVKFFALCQFLTLVSMTNLHLELWVVAGEKGSCCSINIRNQIKWMLEEVQWDRTFATVLVKRNSFTGELNGWDSLWVIKHQVVSSPSMIFLLSFGSLPKVDENGIVQKHVCFFDLLQFDVLCYTLKLLCCHFKM